jgi:hypothetical protein
MDEVIGYRKKWQKAVEGAQKKGGLEWRKC